MANGQELSIGAFCDSISIAEHEILHALGFYHEQSRYDRDDYVEIVFENIQSGSTASWFYSNLLKNVLKIVLS